MDRIRDYLAGLKIHDPRHELSKTPTMVPSDWDRNKYRPILTTADNLGREVTTTTSPKLPIGLEPNVMGLRRETSVRKDAMSDAFSTVPSRTSSTSASSCFSDGGRSASTASSSYVGAYQENRERCKLPTIHDNKESHQQSQFLKPPKETLYEEHIVWKESRDVLIAKPNPRRAFLDRRKAWDEKELLVCDNLEQERRQIRREKRRKEQLRAAKQAKSREESYPYTTNCQVSLGNVLHDTLPEFGETTMTGLDDSQGPYTGDTNCNILPPLGSTEGATVGHRIEYGSKTFFQISSQTDSASSEDDTDWEEESDARRSSDLARFLVNRDAEENLEFEPSIVRSHMTPMRSRVVDRLMVDFWAIFNNSWSTGRRQYGVASDGASQSTSTSTSESSTLSRNSSGVRHVKRSRSDDGEDGETDDRLGRRRKRLDKLPAVGEDDAIVSQFACPYRKRDPRKYSVLEWPRCALKPQKTIARLKAHLYQYHLIQQCLRCKSIFESEEELEAHIMTGERCGVKMGELVDGMTRKMKDQIQCRRKLHPGQTDAEKWEQIYKILFPNEVVPDPYFEPVSDHDMNRPQSPDSVNLADYEAYLRRVLPNLVRNALEVAVSNELEPIETQLQGRMMEIIQEAQNRAFSSFRDMRRSESGARSPAGLDTNIASTVDNNQRTSIETFFQPPPPAIQPVSFSNLSELRISQQSAGHNDASDSGYASHPSLSNSSHHASLDRTESDAMFLSSIYGQTQTNRDIPMDALAFDETQYLNFGGTDGAAASSLLESPHNPPDPLAEDPYAPLFPNETSNNDSLPTQLQTMTEDLFPEEPWYSYIDPMEMNSFDCDAGQSIGET